MGGQAQMGNFISPHLGLSPMGNVVTPPGAPARA